VIGQDGGVGKFLSRSGTSLSGNATTVSTEEQTLYECPACGTQLRDKTGREGSRCACPACGNVINLAVPLELIDESTNPKPKPIGRKVTRWLWKPSRQPYTVFFSIVIALLVALFISECIARHLPERPVEVQIRDWILTCQVTHQGEAKADEAFSGINLETQAFEHGILVDRTYPGTRVSAPVVVAGSQAGGPVKPGTYTLYGTVTSVDVRDKRLDLTDCVFVPTAEKPGK
jgi:predicted RNA-binding Zn-ribbon protein involved in translation (DUF1610 family)